MSNVVRSLWLGYIILLTPWQPSETLLVPCDWYQGIQSSEWDHTTCRFSPHLQFFSSASEVNSRLKVFKTQHLHVHELLPCYKTCWEPRKLLTDPLRCKFQVNWSCSTSPVSAAFCSASEWRGQNTAASDVTEMRSDHQQFQFITGFELWLLWGSEIVCHDDKLSLSTRLQVYIVKLLQFNALPLIWLIFECGCEEANLSFEQQRLVKLPEHFQSFPEFKDCQSLLA